MPNTLQREQRLAQLGFSPGKVDGIPDDAFVAAVRNFQIAHPQLLKPDGIAGPKTDLILFGGDPKDLPAIITASPAVIQTLNPKFSDSSRYRLALAHRQLQALFNAARERIPFEIDDSQRGRAAQEAAFKAGNSMAHFGQSPHNWTPAIACDTHPLPLDWNNTKSFLDVNKIIGCYDPVTGFGYGVAKELRIPITWGGDWDCDGSQTDQKLHDLPHYELRPWREWAKECRPFGE